MKAIYKLTLGTVALLVCLLALPTVSYAADTLDVVAWADPMYVGDGEDTTIVIEITNNTGKDVTLSAYGVDNDFYQIGQGTILANGQTTRIDHVYTVQFGPNDSIGVPVQVNHDGDGGAVVLSFASQVMIYRTSEKTTVDFSFTPDASRVDSGGWINFTITAKNMGNVDYIDFTVTSNGADVQTFDLSPGEEKSVIHSESYFQDTMQTFGYYFSYDSGGAMLSVVQEPVSGMNVTVNQSSATQAPVPTADAPSATPVSTPPTAQDLPTPNADASLPSASVAIDPPAEQAPVDQPTEDAVAATDEPQAAAGISTLSIVLIVVLTSVIIAAVIIIVVVVNKRKQQ